MLLINGMKHQEKSAMQNKHFHLFGCPVYVPGKSLADGAHAQKWKQHSHRNIPREFKRSCKKYGMDT
eukprot:13738350-Ditylum_brightwellii.AAC.1